MKKNEIPAGMKDKLRQNKILTYSCIEFLLIVLKVT